jgi:acyl-lipid omega-6 desaturase (Delta-12 desaturase)
LPNCNQQFLHPSSPNSSGAETFALFRCSLGSAIECGSDRNPCKGELLSIPDRDYSVSGTAEWASIRETTARFRSPSLVTSVGQLASSFLPLGVLYALMYAGLSLGWWATLTLSLVTAGFVVRIFIIQHDCGHGSFLRSRSANDAVGILCSLVTFTPYAMWRRQHAGHHANWNNLDRRVSGVDIYSNCLTVAEYRRLSSCRRLVHRVALHPIVSLLLLPPLVFLVLYRLPFDAPAGWEHERWAVQYTNLALLVLYGSLGFVFGFVSVLTVVVPTMILASIIGVWLFSLQHRFEGVHWSRRDQWSVTSASLQGSSHLRLPKPLQWLTGNIGFHHVHHFDPKVPNYRLERCHFAHPAFQSAPVVTLRGGLSSSRYCLWDEEQGAMVRIPPR